MHLTSIFVTHDQEEAMGVADEIVVMNNGKIEQIGTPAQIYDHPATPFVMSFIGEVNVLPSSARLFQNNGHDIIKTNGYHASYSAFVRPHDLAVQTESDEVTSQAVIKRITHLGWEIQVELILPDEQSVVAHLSREQFADLDLQVNQTVFIKPRQTKFFSESSGFLNFAI